MTTSSFTLEHLETLLFDRAKYYITDYFIPLTDGSHAFLQHDNTYKILDQSTVKTTYFNRMDLRLSKYYFKEYLKLRTVVYELNKPTLYDDKLNLCQQFIHEPKPYTSFSEKTRIKVNIMTEYIKSVLCSNSTPQYEYLMKWIANMAKGNKNNSILYLKGPQGIGKSTITTFLSKYVIGTKLSRETGAEPLVSQFNIELGGKVLVVFEELEFMSIREWNSISTKLKRYTTSDTIMLENKGEARFEAANINNYIINSNHQLQDEDGRRVYLLDISTKRKDDYEYFGRLDDECFNNEVGDAFFSYLHEIDTTNFYAQRFPVTQSKLDAYVKRLGPIEQFLKSEYVLARKDIDNSVANVYDEFKLYCDDTGVLARQSISKIDFNKKMVELGFIHYKSSFKGKSSNKYKITLDELNKVASKGHWIHELDEYVEKKEKNIVNMFPGTQDKYDDEYKEAYEKSQTKLKDIETLLKIATEQNDEQRKKIQDMERQEEDFYNQIEALKKQLRCTSEKEIVIPKVKQQLKRKIYNMMESDNEDSDSDTDDDYEDEYESGEDADDEEYDNMAKLLGCTI